MRSQIIQQTPDFVLTSYGNGAIYTLTNTAQARSVFVQGDDAALFREELEVREKAFPHECALAWFWGEYCDVSQPD